MKALTGIDVQPIDEVKASLSKFGSRYCQLLFTDHELEYCGNSIRTASLLAERFAAKEAMLKVLDTAEIAPAWRSIEVKRAAHGRPAIVLHGSAATLASSQGVRDISLSLSHAGGVAVAVVVATVLSEDEDSDS